jgi:toxin FitB
LIVVDTNVVSELTRKSPAPGVIGWLDSLAAAEVATTAITAAELLYGVARLPDGRRKTELSAAVRELLSEDFGGRVLPFDGPAASRCAEILSHRERMRRRIGIADAQIAAICRAIGATLATRNTNDFEETGVHLVNPWNLV